MGRQKGNKPPKKVVCFSFDSEIFSRFDSYCKQKGSSRSRIVGELVSSLLESVNKKEPDKSASAQP